MTASWNLEFDNFIDCIVYKNKLKEEIIEPYKRKVKQNKSSKDIEIFFDYEILINENTSSFKAYLTDDKEDYEKYLKKNLKENDAEGDKGQAKKGCI